ncbi:hypothetical protein [Bacillus sp. NPDC077027]
MGNWNKKKKSKRSKKENIHIVGKKMTKSLETVTVIKEKKEVAKG